MGGPRLGDNHKPAGVLVETMDDTGPANPADPGEAHATVADQRVDECSVRISWRWVDNHACRLVDDNQMCILEADIERDRLCNRRRFLILGEDYDEILPGADPPRRLADRCSFASHVAGLDQLLM